VPVASLRRKPGRLSFDAAACVGVNYLAAWCGVEAVGLKAGKTILLIGAGGGVGSAVAPIARRLGARVIGAARARRAPTRRFAPSRRRCSSAPRICRQRFVRRLARADVVFDRVGGVMFRSALNCLALRGRLVEIAATGEPEVSFDLVDFYRNESRLFGVDTGFGGGARCAHTRPCRRRLPCRADRRDLRACQGAGGLSQSGGRRRGGASRCGSRRGGGGPIAAPKLEPRRARRERSFPASSAPVACVRTGRVPGGGVSRR
jgi:hypothetical protein